MRTDSPFKTHSPSLGVSRNTFYQNKFVREVLASSKSSVVTLLSRPDLTVGTAVTEQGGIPECNGSNWIMGAATVTDNSVKAAVRTV